MKSLIGCLIPLGAAAVFVAVTGCNSVPVQTRQNVGGPTYPPTNPATVQILREAPSRPNVKLGEITAEPESTSTPVSDIEAKLKEAGAKLGADAVVIVVDKTAVTGATVAGGWYDRQVSPDIGRVVIGVPIRYTGQGATGGAEAP